jgi:hypothetical protein
MSAGTFILIWMAYAVLCFGVEFAAAALASPPVEPKEI